MRSIFGIETEYGLFVAGKDPSDLVEEAIQIVRSFHGKHAQPWDYQDENPCRDMRGSIAPGLKRNPSDAQYDRPDAHSRTLQEEHSDRLLSNGARLYNDHGHPEYSTPECATLHNLVAHDRAGERILLECVRSRAGTSLYKNNTDFHGMSYGCHENYLFPRETPIERLLAGMMPFLATRQIFAGAGKAGSEGWTSPVPLFQISQRSDFFMTEVSVDTLYQRPLFNTRDEPHADPRRWRRIHVICGDANRIEYATALKIGTTAVVLKLLETGWDSPIVLNDPANAVRAISRDQSWLWIVTLKDGSRVRATEIQRHYLEAARGRLGADCDEDTAWVLQEWENVLSGLEGNPLDLADRLDWAAKYSLLAPFLKQAGLDWSADLAQSLDLEYHNLDPEVSLYAGLEQSGAVRRWVTDEEIELAMLNAPQDTRAWIRGEIIRQFPEAVKSASWSRMTLEMEGQQVTLNLDRFAPGLDQSIQERLANSGSLTQWVELLSHCAV